MFQTSYTGLKPLHKNIHYFGGWCRFWYIPIEDVLVFPRVNAANQQLVDEPALKEGAAWYGPIEVPDDRLGFTEELKSVKAGDYYDIKIEGLHIGDSPESRVNLRNMKFHRYLVVGQVRAGGFYNLVGTNKSFCKFTPIYKSGNSPADTAQTIFTFTTESRDNAQVLPSFSADTFSPELGGGGNGGSNAMNNKEAIPFQGVSSVPIVWTPTRLERFGYFPTIQAWLRDENGNLYLSHGGEILADAPPPAFTELQFNIGAPSEGVLIIS